jgi:5-hydroxyisourate hydrolase-like protein (transthyretin family)
MRAFIKLFTFTFFLFLFASSIPARPASMQANGSITGHVTLAGKPAPNVTVMLSRAPTHALKKMSAMFEAKPVTRVTTDTEGVYRFEHLAAGRYSLTTYAPAYVAPPEPTSSWQPGRVINVAEGEAVENQDFALTRGGVVTGRVTDAQSHAVVGQVITLTPVDDDKPAPPVSPLAGSPFGRTMYMTDDRGVYRIYGLSAGRYFVSLGGAGESGFNALGKQRYHEQTYHPGVTDKAKAVIIEVKEGAEASGIDIRLGLPSQTYKAGGRVVDAATGKPFSAAAVNYGAAPGETKTVAPRALGTTPNARGEFQLDAIVPGKYHAFAWLDKDSEFYSDAAPFEVTNADVTGITIKVHRGQTVSGTVVVEGGADAETQARLAQLRLQAVNLSDGISAPRQMNTRIAPDGSFRLTGVQPGRLSFYTNQFYDPTPTKFTVLRTERGGQTQRDGLQIAAGESVTDVRVVLAMTSGTLRGEVKAAGNGSLDDYGIYVTASRIGGEPPFSRDTNEMDANNRFIIEDLIPGDYEVDVQVMSLEGRGGIVASTKQQVTVLKDVETSVTLTVDLSAKKGKDK